MIMNQQIENNTHNILIENNAHNIENNTQAIEIVPENNIQAKALKNNSTNKFIKLFLYYLYLIFILLIMIFNGIFVYYGLLHVYYTDFCNDNGCSYISFNGIIILKPVINDKILPSLYVHNYCVNEYKNCKNINYNINKNENNKNFNYTIQNNNGKKIIICCNGYSSYRGVLLFVNTKNYNSITNKYKDNVCYNSTTLINNKDIDITNTSCYKVNNYNIGLNNNVKYSCKLYEFTTNDLSSALNEMSLIMNFNIDSSKYFKSNKSNYCHNNPSLSTKKYNELDKKISTLSLLINNLFLLFLLYCWFLMKINIIKIQLN